MQAQMNDIHNHTNPHVFRFVKGSDNHGYMHAVKTLEPQLVGATS